MQETESLSFRIGGAWVTGESPGDREDRNPADQRDVLARYRLLNRAQMAQVMDAAESGQRRWRAMGALARAAVLRDAAARLRADKSAIARTITRENGKLLAEAGVEVDKSADFLEYYAGIARTPGGGFVADGRPETTTTVRTEPIGIVAMITPWNDPMLTPARKLGPALISGNAVVLKPARDTPLAAWHITRALVEAGLPDGVLNLVMTDHATFDETVLGDRRLAGVTFTGSTGVGLQLGRRLGGTNIRLQTEMGGKNASVILADADLDGAVATVVAAAFGQAGQRCTATSRLIVEQQVHDAVLERLTTAVRALTPAPGLQEGAGMCPLVSTDHRDAVLAHLADAREDGARIVAGGDKPDDAALAHGCFVLPTLIADVTPDMRIWREEAFGPVLAVRAVASFDEAVEAVNDSDYGLAAALFTRDLAHAQRFIDRAEVGQVTINLPTTGWDVHQPFGGFKQSGSAFKEQGEEGLRFYTRVKTAAVRSAI